MRRSRTRRVTVPATVLGLALFAGACGGSTATSTGSGSERSATGESAGTPIEQLLGGSASQRALEDQVAACMRERGWQYTPNTAAFDGTMGADPMQDPSFREQYGYGISTQPPVEAFGGSVIDNSKDPNAAYVSSLGADDQQRYLADLWGGGTGGTSGDDTTAVASAVELDPNSCQSKASEAIAEQYPEVSKAFMERFGELFEAMRREPAMVSAMQKWSACMATSNFTYTDVDEIYSDLQRRSGEILGSGTMAASTDAQAASGPTPTMSVADKERLDKLQREEKAIAEADAACRVDTVDKVRPELEQELADKLRSEFPGIGGSK